LEKTNWRGEGIAQSIENILFNSCKEIQYDIYTAKSVAGEILDSFEEKQITCNVNFLKGVTKKRKKNSYIVDINSLDRTRLLDILNEYVDSFYSSKFFKYSIWVPTPILRLKSKKNRSKIYYNFWDPFVFEYSFFNFYTKYFFYHRLGFIKKLGYGVITQSEFNKNYLINVLGFDSDRINVIRLGGPSQSNPTNSFESLNFSLYPPRHSRSFVSIRSIINELDNRSALFRITGRLKQNTKILFVTTQNRPYKGLYRLLKIYEEILAENDVFLITTADISKLINEDFPYLSESVCMLRRVTNKQHQFLIQSSDLIIHPSYVEGGQGSFSMFEAAMMNKPSLVNWGRHIEEFKFFSPCENTLGKFSVDFDKSDSVKEIICSLLYDEKLASENVEIIKKLNYSWADSASRYVEVFSK
jgi:glycosyltransferase involved in cell wall biosynthesis